LFEYKSYEPDESVEFADRFYSAGVFRYDLTTGAVDRADCDFPLPRSRYNLLFAGSPDGQEVALARSLWHRPLGGGSPVRVPGMTILATGFAPGTQRELITLGGGPYDHWVHRGLQWSPDATKLAVAIGESGKWFVLVLDLVTGQELFRVAGQTLCGSASWSPGSDRLLTRDFYSEAVSVFDLGTGECTPVPALPAQAVGASSGRYETMALGFAGHDRVLVATQRGSSPTMTLTAIDLTTNEREPLLRFNGDESMYPTMAAMSADHWD
jgi:hypothetical protein